MPTNKFGYKIPTTKTNIQPPVSGVSGSGSGLSSPVMGAINRYANGGSSGSGLQHVAAPGIGNNPIGSTSPTKPPPGKEEETLPEQPGIEVPKPGDDDDSGDGPVLDPNPDDDSPPWVDPMGPPEGWESGLPKLNPDPVLSPSGYKLPGLDGNGTPQNPYNPNYNFDAPELKEAPEVDPETGDPIVTPDEPIDNITGDPDDAAPPPLEEPPPKEIEVPDTGEEPPAEELPVDENGDGVPDSGIPDEVMKKYLESVFGTESSFDPVRAEIEAQYDAARSGAAELAASRGLNESGMLAAQLGDLFAQEGRDVGNAYNAFRQQDIANKNQAAQMAIQDDIMAFSTEQQKALADAMLEIEKRRKYGEDYEKSENIGDYEYETLLGMLEGLDPDSETYTMLERVIEETFGEEYMGDPNENAAKKENFDKWLAGQPDGKMPTPGNDTTGYNNGVWNSATDFSNWLNDIGAWEFMTDDQRSLVMDADNGQVFGIGDTSYVMYNNNWTDLASLNDENGDNVNDVITQMGWNSEDPVKVKRITDFLETLASQYPDIFATYYKNKSGGDDEFSTLLEEINSKYNSQE